MKVKLFLILIQVLLLISCNNKEKQTVKIKGKYSLELSQAFKKASTLNKDASLQYQDIARDLYVIVIDEPKAELKNVLEENGLSEIYSDNLDGYSRIIMEGMNPKLTLDSIPPLKDTAIDNLKAKETSFEGESEGIKIYWKFAFVEGKNTYYQIMVWTSAANRARLEKEMQQIVKSFREKDRSKKQKA